MDRREEYWGHHPIIHDPEEYNSPPPSSYDTFSHHPAHHNIQPSFTPEHTHGLPPPPQQQQPQYRFDHRSSRNTAINTDDVLCGRGKTSFNHEGNKVFRNAVSAALDDFVNAVNRFEKALVVQRVVDSVQSRGGRFLKEDTREGGWYQLSEQQSKEKVGHAIRDAANLYEVRKQKEKIVQSTETPQLKNAGESDDDNVKPPGWWAYSAAEESSSLGRRQSISKASRSSYTPTDYGAVSSSGSATAKRRGVAETTTDYQPQRKRRRTTSPNMYFSTTMALSDQILSTPSPPHQPNLDTILPSKLRRSPIIHPPTATSTRNVVSSGSITSSSGMLANVPTNLKPSPIAPNTHTGVHSVSHRQKRPTQYTHRFTLYDPQQQQQSTPRAAGLHGETTNPYSSPTEHAYPQHHFWDRESQQPIWRASTPYQHSTSDIPEPSYYDERAYHQQYRQYPPPNPTVPPVHRYPYPQQYQQQLPLGPPPLQRRRSTISQNPHSVYHYQPTSSVPHGWTDSYDTTTTSSSQEADSHHDGGSTESPLEDVRFKDGGDHAG